MPEPRRRARQRPARVIPSSTYRLQLRPDFGFAAAAGLTSYLARLGVSHLYASPSLQAAPGSPHGYDVVDPRRVNAELGGERGHRRLSEALEQHGLGQVLDIVPNHLAISGPENPWWWDLLENGPSSRYARFFDVDWDPPEARDRNLVLLPILGDHYGRVLEAGELALERHGGTISLRYHERVLPLSPRSLDGLLAAAASRARSDELAFLAQAHTALPRSTVTDGASLRRRHRDKGVLQRLLSRLLDEQPRVRRALDEVLAATTTDVDALDALLARQNYRLARWQAAGRDLGYRRFFDVTSLIGLRVEDPVVFEDVHALVRRWVERGILDGLRVDHPDGLHDPAAYLRRLRAASPRGWLIVEKILMPGEPLPQDWPVDGTTGYDFLRDVTGVLVDPSSEAAFDATHARLTGEARGFAAVAREARLVILRDTLGSELNRLTARLLAICEGRRRYRDFTRHELHEALREVAASMPVYRTYARAEAGVISPRDVEVIEAAVAAAREARPDLVGELLDLLADILSLRIRGPDEADLVGRFQQLSGAVMAKGVEDTAFYRYLRLLALNEVGGEPGRFGLGVAGFHAANAERRARWPASMLTTSTHDTKRSEDVRARLASLSEMPETWRRMAGRWLRRFRRLWSGVPFDPGLGYLAAQTLAGAWPLDGERLAGYLVKAAREARLRTSWTEPDVAYEAAVEAFARTVTTDAETVRDLDAALVPVVRAGRVNALSQILLKLTSPGVPDIYQGNELWDLSLVDPDNRRAVDFEHRHVLLAELEAALVDDPLAGPGPAAILARADEGLPKLWVTRQALHLRRARPDLYGPDAAYEPLVVEGGRADHVVAFLRGEGASLAATVVPRLPHVLSGGRLGDDLMPERRPWGASAVRLPDGHWRDVLGGSRHRARDGRGLRLSRVLGSFPVALLIREGDSTMPSGAR
jgi:(1->4)-alpha-D-glucan 1-alpha-D-glucosylmutase